MMMVMDLQKHATRIVTMFARRNATILEIYGPQYEMRPVCWVGILVLWMRHLLRVFFDAAKFPVRLVVAYMVCA